MNESVKAQGMSIKAKSDAAFLLIAAYNDLDPESSAYNADIFDVDYIRDQKDTEASAAKSTDTLFPVAHSTITKTSEADTITNWYFAYSDDPEDAFGTYTESTLVHKPIADGQFSKYVLKNQFGIALADGSAAVSNLRVSAAAISPSSSSAVKVLVTTSTAAEEFPRAASATPVTLASSVPANDYVMVNVYIYWDGNEDVVFTNNFENLVETSVTLTFTADIA